MLLQGWIIARVSGAVFEKCMVFAGWPPGGNPGLFCLSHKRQDFFLSCTPSRHGPGEARPSHGHRVETAQLQGDHVTQIHGRDCHTCDVVLSTPAKKKDTGFGTKNPELFSLKGTIYELPEDAQEMPGDFSKLKSIGVIYTDKLDVPIREFTEGFPGVTNRFEWFGIVYTGAFETHKTRRV